MTSSLIGIDGGGSKTTALLADDDGKILGRGYADSSNHNSVGKPAAKTALRQAIAAAWADAGLAPQPVQAICLGMAGIDRPADRAWLEAWAAQERLADRILVVNDAQLILAAGTPEGWGIGVISGTGSIVFGRAADGRTARAGGWGYLLGDEGSGYAIGLAALRAVTQAADGRGPATLLTEKILRHWSLAAPTDLIGHVYNIPRRGKDNLRAELAWLAGLVEEAAIQGDSVALEIMCQAGNELARGVIAVIHALQMPSRVACALAGGVLIHSQLVGSALLEAVRPQSYSLEPVSYVDEPAQGAVRLAKGCMSVSHCCRTSQD